MGTQKIKKYQVWVLVFILSMVACKKSDACDEKSSPASVEESSPAPGKESSPASPESTGSATHESFPAAPESTVSAAPKSTVPAEATDSDGIPEDTQSEIIDELGPLSSDQEGTRLTSSSVQIYNNSENSLRLKLGIDPERMKVYELPGQEKWLSPSFGNETDIVFSLQTNNDIIRGTLALGKAYILFWNRSKAVWDIQSIETR
jgi:hypothetical protein